MTPEELYTAIKDLQGEEAIKSIAQAFDKWIREKYSTLKSVRTQMTDFNKLIKTIPLVEGKNAYYYNKENGEKLLKHLFYKYAGLTPEEYGLLNAESNTKKEERLDNGTLLEPLPYLEAVGKLLTSDDYRELTIGIIAATGRRPCEILLRGSFNLLKSSELVFPENQPITHWLSFSGQVKKRRNTANESYAIATLFPADCIIKAVKRLRKMPEVAEQLKTAKEQLKLLAFNKEEQSEELAYQLALKENDLIDDKFETVTNRAVKNHLPHVLSVRHEKQSITRSSLRAAYARLATFRDCPSSKNDLLWASRLLGHKEEKGDLRALLTTVGYFDYYLDREAIVPLLDEPKAEATAVFRGFISDVDDVKNFQDQWGITNQAETFRKIWELAKEAIAARERKLFEKVEEINNEKETIEMQAKEELLGEVAQMIDDRLSKALAALQSVPLVIPAPTPIRTANPTPTLDSNQDVIKPTEPPAATEPAPAPVTEKDWVNTPTEELKGKKIPGSAEEKIRRAIQGIIDFNDYTAPSNNERWFIGVRSIQDLSGCNYSPIKKFVDDYSTMIADHNAKYGLSNQHNKRHTKKITEIIANW